MRHYRFILLPALLTAALACSKQASPQDDGKLYIRAAGVPFSEEGSLPTKATNYGYLTAFEPGDAIGVTGVTPEGNIVPICNNIKFIYDSSTEENGTVWTTFRNERGFSFIEKTDGASYFAYYPYDSRWDGHTLDEILAEFTTEEDQSTTEAFNRSDLMTPTEIQAPAGNELRFVMYHRMATIALFYNNEWEPDGETPLYRMNLYPQTSPASLTTDHTYRANMPDGNRELRRRYLVNPRTTPEVKLTGALEETSLRLFSHTVSVQAGHLYSISFEGEPLVPYTDGVDMELEDVEFTDRDGNTVTLGHKVIWSRYNLGESLGESYPFDPAEGDRGGRSGTRDPYARGDYYAWGATFTQYDNGISGYNGYGYNNYFDKEYKLAPMGGTIKETEYDVAHAKWWRGKWRLPTENEFRALFAGCTFELVETYSETLSRYIGNSTKTMKYNVFKVTRNDNPEKFIYLPSGGYTDGTMLPVSDGNGGYTDSGDGKKNDGLKFTETAYYLSSSASPTILRCVSYAYFNATSQIINANGSRYTGMLVRPVYSPDEIIE